MREFFEKQLNDTTVAPSSGKYFNGEEYQEGDKILYAMMSTQLKYDENNVPNYDIEFIVLNESHIDDFEPTPATTLETTLPIVKLK